MALVEVARFASLIEAQIAAGALRADGFAAEVFDGHLGANDWLHQIALGGFRLMAPEEERREAFRRLAELRADAPEPAFEQPATGGLRAAMAVILALFLHPTFGLLLAKRWRARPEEETGWSQ